MIPPLTLLGPPALYALWNVYAALRARGAMLRVPRDAPQRAAWPKLSLIVPACNEGGTIEAATKATLASDYPNIEIVLELQVPGISRIRQRSAPVRLKNRRPDVLARPMVNVVKAVATDDESPVHIIQADCIEPAPRDLGGEVTGAGFDDLDRLLLVQILTADLNFLIELKGELCGQCHEGETFIVTTCQAFHAAVRSRNHRGYNVGRC